jgi:peptide/nickel transport system substrate-binding protein
VTEQRRDNLRVNISEAKNTGEGESFRARFGRVSRRDFIQGTVGAASLALGGGLLSACSSAPQAAVSPTTGRPSRGGTLQAGLTGGSSADSFDPAIAATSVADAFAVQVFDNLTTYDRNAQVQPYLAREITPNKDATVWTIRLREGVTFHDGKPLTADDVIYTFKRIVNPKAPTYGASYLRYLLPNGMKKLDKLTVQLEFSRPFASFPQALIPTLGMEIVPVGFDPKHPIGTGPFKFASFSPGQQATLMRNENYWQHGLPYADSLVITFVADETAAVNGLVSGQFNVINNISPDSVSTVTSGGGIVLASEGGGFLPIVMRTDLVPFSDVRVRQAFRLIAGRQQINDAVFGGHGRIGNDLYAPYDPVYNHALPQREQDIPQAKHLLKAAGHEGLVVTLVTGPIAQGVVELAQVFAQQALAAGVKINLQSVPPGTFFGPNWLHWGLTQDFWVGTPYFITAWSADLPTGTINETHFNNPTYTRLFYQAQATTSEGMRTEIAHEMQSIYYQESGYVIPCFTPIFDGYRKNVHGNVTSKTGQPFNAWDFKSLWLT